MRHAGHDVLWIRDAHRGMSDETILEMSVRESRVLVTFDKDFGELAFKAKLSADCGIVLFRIRKQSPDILAKRVSAFIDSRNDRVGHFAVIEEDRIRMTRLPGGDSGTAGKISPAT
jgi:predicted nuclease of predicted toxin-antitoxin system